MPDGPDPQAIRARRRPLRSEIRRPEWLARRPCHLAGSSFAADLRCCERTATAPPTEGLVDAGLSMGHGRGDRQSPGLNFSFAYAAHFGLGVQREYDLRVPYQSHLAVWDSRRPAADQAGLVPAASDSESKTPPPPDELDGLAPAASLTPGRTLVWGEPRRFWLSTRAHHLLRRAPVELRVGLDRGEIPGSSHRLVSRVCESVGRFPAGKGLVFLSEREDERTTDVFAHFVVGGGQLVHAVALGIFVARLSVDGYEPDRFERVEFPDRGPAIATDEGAMGIRDASGLIAPASAGERASARSRA